MFRKIVLVSLLTISILLISGLETNAATFETYTYGSIGYNNGMLNFTMAKRYINNFGVELGFGYRTYPNINDYPCPHSNYIIIENKYQNMIGGLDVLGYFDFTEYCSIYGGIGLYYKSYQRISRSNVTGWVYNEGSTSEFVPAFSGGFQYHVTNNSGFGIGYNSIRGANFQFILNL